MFRPSYVVDLGQDLAAEIALDKQIAEKALSLLAEYPCTFRNVTITKSQNAGRLLLDEDSVLARWRGESLEWRPS